MGRQMRAAAAVLLAAVLGAGSGGLWHPAPAAAQETIRQLSWHLDAMHVEAAHDLATGDGVTVGVVDTGVDASHPDLEGQVLEGGEVGDSGSGQADQDGHGTGMASLIAGKGDRGANSVLGVAPKAKILPVKVAQNSDGAFRPQDVYQGVRWAIDHGASIVNISLGGERSVDAPWKKRLIDYAISKDVVLIAAAGNTGSGDKKVAEPASIPGVVAVSGLTRNGAFWDGSAKGAEVVVSAPAKGLPHAVPTNVADSGYALADGTSGATALVSGVAALIRDAFPDATANDVVNRIIQTAEDRGDDGRDQQYGYGAVDAMAALEGEIPSVKHHPLVSPEAAKSDEQAAAAKAAGRRAGDQRALVVVGVFIGSVTVLLVAAYLVFLVRRSRQVVVTGVPPQHPGLPGVAWGPPQYGPAPYGPGPPGAQPAFGQQPSGWPSPGGAPPWHGRQSPAFPQQPGPAHTPAQQPGPLSRPHAYPAAPRPAAPPQGPAPSWHGPSQASAPGWPARQPPGWPPAGETSAPPACPEPAGQRQPGAGGHGSGADAVTQSMPVVPPAPGAAQTPPAPWSEGPRR